MCLADLFETSHCASTVETRAVFTRGGGVALITVEGGNSFFTCHAPNYLEMGYWSSEERACLEIQISDINSEHIDVTLKPQD